MAITLSVIKGNYQLVPANLGEDSKDIVIQVLNAGAPVVGATVTITCTEGLAPIGYPGAATTDASGNLTIRFIPGTIQQSQGYAVPYHFTAAYGGSSVAFIETAYYVSTTFIQGIYAFRLAPTPAELNPYRAQAGVAGVPFKLQILTSDTLRPVPNVGVAMIVYDDHSGGLQEVVTLAGAGADGQVLTDSTGTATLTPTFATANSALPGGGGYESFRVSIGGDFNYFGPFQFQITVGSPGTTDPPPLSGAGSTILLGSGSTAAAVPGVGAHSWWRLYCTKSQETFGEVDLIVFGLDLYDATGTLIPATGGSVVASPRAFGQTEDSAGVADHSAYLAFDNNDTTYYKSDYAPYVPSYPQWVGYHFPSPVTPTHFVLVTGQYNHPTEFILQFSDNGTTWSNAVTPIVEHNWTPQGVYSERPAYGFAIASSPAGYYLSIRVKMTANGGNTDHYALAQFSVNAADGTDLTTGLGNYSTSSDANYPPRFCFDGDPATAWTSAAVTPPHWVSANFKTPKRAVSVTLAAPQDVQYGLGLNSAPTAGTIEGSNDGGQTWDVLGTFTGLTWPNSNPQTIPIIIPIAPPAPIGTTVVPPSSCGARGNIQWNQIRATSRHGCGPSLQSSDQTGVDGNLAMFRGGVLTDSGVSVAGAATAAASPPVTGITITLPPELLASILPGLTGVVAVAITKALENANTVWAGPVSGAPGVPTFRALVAADIPAGAGGGSTHSEVLTDASGALVITSSGDTIYVGGIPN